MEDKQSLIDDLNRANKLMQEYKKAVDESTIFSIGDTKGKILYANKQFIEVSGYSLKELVGQPHSIVRDPQMPKEAFKEMWQTIQNKKVWKGMVVNRKKNGERYYVEATIVPILDADGNITEYAGIRNDITKLVLKEKELAKLKDQQRSQDIQKALEINTEQLLDSIPFASVMVDLDTLTLNHSNKIFQELFYNNLLLHENEKVSLKTLLVQEGEYVFEDDLLSLIQRYELMMPKPIAAIELDATVQEFYIGVKQLSNNYIITLVPKG